MKIPRLAKIVILTALLALAANVAYAQGTAFTYQGRLTDGGSLASGSYDLRFKLYDAATAGALQGSPNTVTTSNVTVTSGVFTVKLDFGSTAFTGGSRYLEIEARPHSTDPNIPAFTPLAPRQELTPTPYAIHALNSATAASAPWAGLTGVPLGFADNLDNDTTYTAGTGLELSFNHFQVNFSTVQARVSSSCASGSAITGIGPDGSVTCQTFGPSAGLSTTGTTPAVGGRTVLALNYASATTLTNLTGGVAGQCVALIVVGGQPITVNNNSNFSINGGTWTGNATNSLTVCRYSTLWYEAARSNPASPPVIASQSETKTPAK